jgi:hypothetical protein
MFLHFVFIFIHGGINLLYWMNILTLRYGALRGTFNLMFVLMDIEL